MTRKFVAIACIAAVLFTIVVIVTFVATSLGLPVRVAFRSDSPRVIAQDVALVANASLRGPPLSA